MPNINAAKKHLRQTKKRTERNNETKKAYRDAVKAVKKAVSVGEKDMVEKIKLVQKKLDKAAQKGVIKKNAAARKLSRLMKQIKKVAIAK